MTTASSSIATQSPPTDAHATASGSSAGGPSTRSIAIKLALILLLALWLRMHGLNQQSLWVDEVYSLEISTGHGYRHLNLPIGEVIAQPPNLTGLSDARPISDVWRSQANDSHPPFYFVALRVWRDLFGESDRAARMLSVVVSLISVLLMFDVARLTLRSPTLALWAALLMAMAAPQIAYAREVRGYALLVMLGLATALALVRIEKLGWSWLRAIGLTFGTLAMLLTHYGSAGLILGLGLYVIIRLRGATRVRVIACFAVAVVGFGVMWGPVLRSGLVADQNRWLVDGGPNHVWRTLQRYAILPLQLLAEPMKDSRGIAMVSAVVYALPLLLLRRRPELLLGSLWMLATIGFIATLDLARSTNQVNFIRYTLLAGPGLCLILAAALGDRPQKWMRHVLPVLCVFYCFVSLESAYPSKQNWRGMANYMTRSGRAGDVAIFATTPMRDGWEEEPGVLYLCTSHALGGRMPGPVVLLDEADALTPELLAEIQGAPRVWVLTGFGMAGPERWIPDSKVVTGSPYLFPEIGGSLVRVTLRPPAQPTPPPPGPM